MRARRQQALLNLGRGVGLLAAAGGVQDIGVAVRQLERRRAVLCDLGELLLGRAKGEQEPGRASAQPHGGDHAVRQLGARGGQDALAVSLGPLAAT